jgi:4-hydroxy-tetrahydrodipicolinate synthase
MKSNLNGLIPAIVIPLRKNFEIDEETFKQYVEKISSCDIKAIAVNTDAGEGNFLQQEERKRVIQLVREVIKDRFPLVCGLGGTNIQEVLESAKQFKDLGVDYFLVFPHPSFKGGKSEHIINYHEEIAEVGIPLIIFQLQESLGGTLYDFKTLEELTKIEEVVAIKEASFDVSRFKETVSFLNLLPKKITILTGNDNFILESFILGADGALLGFGAVFTAIQAKAIAFLKEQKNKEAGSLFASIEELCSFCFKEPVRDYRSRIKEVLVAQGILKTSLVKPPLSSISEEEKEIIHNLVSKLK